MTTEDKNFSSEAAAAAPVDVIPKAPRESSAKPTAHGPKTSAKIGGKKLTFVQNLAIMKMQRMDNSPVEIIPGK